MQYRVSCPEPASQFLELELQIEQVKEEVLHLQLSAWRPGKYFLQDFAKNIFYMKAEDADGKPLLLKKVSKDRWQLEAQACGTVRVRYNYLAVQMDAGGSWADDAQVYINWVNCGLLVEEREEESIGVSLDLPSDYQTATSLSEEGGKLVAPNFDALVDSPMISSPSLMHEQYRVGGCTFHVWVQGRAHIDWKRLLHDFERFSKVQIDAFGGFPCKDYHFLIQALPYRHYHGVEHQHSTVLTLGPSEQLMDELYDDLLGVSSHELYHTWNVTRLRPKELLPYRWDTYTYFETGFVAEGITTYYGDVMLSRAGVWDKHRYLKELALFFQRHFDNPARAHAALSDSSYDLWLDGYSPRQPKRKASIYVKGALVAFLLDVKLRQESKGEHSLDTFMKRLWELYAISGYSIQDYEANIAHFLGEDYAADYMNRFVHGTEDLWPLLEEALDWLGIEARRKSSLSFKSTYGIKVIHRDGVSKVMQISEGSPASKKLSIGDEIVAVNHRKVGKEADELLRIGPDRSVALAVFRHRELLLMEVEADGQTYYPEIELKAKEQMAEREKERLQAWIGSRL